MKRWSTLQRDIYRLIDEKINFQIHCVKYPDKNKFEKSHRPRYWITLNKEIIWDYPKDFLARGNYLDENREYPYYNDAPVISDLLREYIETPKEVFFEKCFENDKWGLTDILKAADRRTGKRRLPELKNKDNAAVAKIIEERMK